MIALIEAVNAHLDRLDFEQLWPGFAQTKYAIYTRDKAYFSDKVIDRPEAFFGNTAIFFEGKWCAIWYVEDIERVECTKRLTACLVHEMFHAYQFAAGETRFPNEIEALDYTFDETLLTLKREENARCKDFLLGTNEHLDLSDVRVLKEKTHPFEHTYDCLIESVEGLAHFVEGEALKVLDMSLYQVFLEEIIRALEAKDAVFDFRMNAYKTGFALATFYLKNKIDFKKPLKPNLMPLYIHEKKEPFKVNVKDEVKAQLKAFMVQRNSELFRLKNNGKKVWEGPFELVGFDPLNTYKVDEYIVFKTLLAVKKSDTLFLKGQGIALLKDGKIQSVVMGEEDGNVK